jgi:hypothetical protein
MSYVNPISFGDISTEVNDPVSITIGTLKVSGTELVTALRFEYPDVAGDEGVDISDKVAVVGQVATVTDIWETGETRTAGLKRVQIVAKNSDDSVQDEVNIFVNVLY